MHQCISGLWLPYPRRESRYRYIIALTALFVYMGCVRYIISGRMYQQIHLNSIADDIELSRRLSESRAQSRPQGPLRPWLDPPAPIMRGVWNATSIKWVGKSFYFQTHDDNVQGNIFQLYTPHQIQKAFRHHSILLQGDSTVRRLYGTLNGILSYDVWTGSTSMDKFPSGFPANVPNPPFGIPATYFARRGLVTQAKGVDPQRLLSTLIHAPAPIDPRLLEHRTVVDVNKDFYTEPCTRKLPPSYMLHMPFFGSESQDDIDNPDKDQSQFANTAFKTLQFEYKVCRLHPTGGWLPTMPSRSLQQSSFSDQPQHHPLLYDYVNTNCMGHMYDYVSQELAHQQSITKQYSLFIVGPGVWETVKKAHCQNPYYEKLQSNGLQWPHTISTATRNIGEICYAS